MKKHLTKRRILFLPVALLIIVGLVAGLFLVEAKTKETEAARPILLEDASMPGMALSALFTRVKNDFTAGQILELEMDEVIDKRTRSSKTHSLGGNKFAWDGTIGSIHYEDNGWQEIDNYFEPAVAPWDWQMLEAGYQVRVKEDFTAGQIIEFETQGETIQLQPMALEWTNDLDQIQPISMPQNVTPVITNPEVDLLPAVGMLSHQGTIRWDDAYGQGIDFEWQCTSTRLAKTLEIENFNNLPIPQQYIIDGGNPVLRLNLIFEPPSNQAVDIVVDGQVWNQQSVAQTFKMIEFRKDGESLWGFMPLRYWGSYSGEDEALEEANRGQSIATLEKRGNKLYISIRVPFSWLQSATYPIFIDTDIDPQPALVGASLDDAYEIGDGNWYPTADYLQVKTDGFTSTNNYRCGGIRWSINIAQSSTIDVAYQMIYVISYDDPNLKIYANAVDDAENFDSAPTGDPHVISRARTDGTGVDGDGYASWVQEDIGKNDWKNSPSIVNVIQEIINREGWEANNYLSILWIADILSPSKWLMFRSWEYNDHSLAPKLHIEYTAAGPVIAIIAKVNGVAKEDIGEIEGVSF